MSGSDAPHYASIAEIADAYRTRRLSPVEITRAQLDRIAGLNPRLNAYVSIFDDRAMRSARAAESAFTAGWDVGPLQGVPIGLKDLVDLSGELTTAGSRWYNVTPDGDSTVVERLEAAGAVILGKQHMHEFACGGPLNDRFGETHNPWKPGAYTGGSSSGSGVAVAAGLCFGAIGSDTAGSIRLPAAYCGCVGIKPTYGRVPVRGAVTLSWSLDHLGPLTRTVQDAAIMLQAIAGSDELDPYASLVPVPNFSAQLNRGVAGLRIAVPRTSFFEDLHPETAAKVEDALDLMKGLGASVADVQLPDIPEAVVTLFNIMHAETAAFHEQMYEEHKDEYASTVSRRIEAGRMISSGEYLRAKREQIAFTRAVEGILDSFDVIVTPTVPAPAPPVEQITGESSPVRIRWTGPFDLTGQPAISVPCGFSSDGLPIALQIVGRRFDEPTVFRAAAAFEQMSPSRGRYPDL